MLKSIRAKILLAILTVTMFTACSLTVVFYFRAAGMIEENYSGILYGRMQQTIKDLDESLKEIYYVNTRTAWDTDIRNNARTTAVQKMKTAWKIWPGFSGNTVGNIKISTPFILSFQTKKWR